MIAALSQSRRFTGAARQAYRDVILAQGPVAYYELESNANDSSGNGYNGTATAISYATGKVGNAATFNGSTSFISVANNAAFRPAAFSVSLWAKTSANTVLFARNYGNVNFRGWGVRSAPASGAAGFWVGGGSWLDSATAINTNAWRHIVCTYASTACTIYVDGASVATGTRTANLTDSVAMEFGRNESGGGYFAMNFDEFSFFSRALSAAEVLAQYTAAG
jgi:hypothetical protein